MYAAKVDGQRLNFAVSGKLWKRSLVMIDEETKTLWSQILGKAMEGKLKDQTLNIFPSVLTSWSKWKQNYPNTSVIKLSRTSRSFRNDYYQNPEKFVVGLSNSSEAKAWSFDCLQKRPLVNDEFDQTPIVVTFDIETGAAQIFESTVGGKKFEFYVESDMILDKNTKSTWDPTTGKAIAGELKGKRLMPVPSIPSFRKSWENFFPNTKFWNPK